MWVPDDIQNAVSMGNHKNLDCVWDETGCGMVCDENKMKIRCATLSHDKNVCESQIGRDYRCTWSTTQDVSLSSLMDSVRSTLKGIMDDEDVASTDILLGFSLFVSMSFALFQCYKWRCHKNGEYEKLPDEMGPGAPVLLWYSMRNSIPNHRPPQWMLYKIHHFVFYENKLWFKLSRRHCSVFVISTHRMHSISALSHFSFHSIPILIHSVSDSMCCFDRIPFYLKWIDSLSLPFLDDVFCGNQCYDLWRWRIFHRIWRWISVPI